VPYVNCPHCDAKQLVPADMLGLMVECRGCKHDFEAEGDDPPPRRTAGRRRRSGGEAPWGLLKWVSVGVGAALILIAMNQLLIHSPAYSAVACFCAILGRIFQAEEHRG